MIKELLYKWFGLEPLPCQTCEVLRSMLDESNRERKELLHKLLAKEQPEPLIENKESIEPILPQFVPWRVRQQMLEAEDRRKHQLMKDKEKEIAASKQSVSESIEKLEEELGVNNNAS